MNTSKAKAKNTERESIKVESFEVKSVRVITTKNGDDLIFFSLNLNGVWINNCKVATGKNGDFIGWPQYKGSDGNYYNYVYASISDEDNKKIMDAIQEAIDNA